MKKQILKSALIALAGVGLMAGSAMASPLPSMTGSIQLGGIATLEDAAGNAVNDYTLAKQIDFLDITQSIPTNMSVASGLGTFAGIPVWPTTVAGIIYDFTFLPNLSPAPTKLWEFNWAGNTFEFNMTSIAVDAVTNNSISLIGQGMIEAASTYEDTPGQWKFSIQNGGITNFQWSASQTASPVPEPATMLLFGVGIAGLAGVARRKKN